MKILFKNVLWILSILLVQAGHLNGQNINNPVLPGVADAGVLKYNGKYYIGGVRTDGDFYVSDDLVRWTGPVHVFSMDNDWTRGTGAGDNQIHANDMLYINGTFHLYWSVNHWGRDRHIVHIGHAVSDKVLGPYHEPMKETWIDNRIDPKVFQDDDGKLYMYMVRFTDGNTIWVRPLNDDGYTFSGPPYYQFASLPGTWERMDNSVAEGPWVLKYRDRYYMMYNGNHTGTAWGNYQLGVAEADSPVLFNNGNKYPYPLLLSNQTAIEETHTNLLLFNGQQYDPLFSYTTGEPASDWKKQRQTDWKKGRTGFSSREIEGSTVRKYGTEWTSDRLYLQKAFTPGATPGNLALQILHDGDTRVYLNGTLIYDKQGPDYRMVNIDGNAKKALRPGENILAVETAKGRRGNYLNLALFDMQFEVADDILFSPGQPNILHGPNGFEWWLIYMANKNNEQRGQYISRIHFFDKTMYSDGVTSSRTEGYFPAPAQPTRREMPHPEGATAHTLIDKQYAGTAYLFEAGVKTSANAGIIAWQKDENNWIRIGLDLSAGQWYMATCFNGAKGKQSYALPSGFKPGVFHTIRIERNLNRLEVRIDDLPAPGQMHFDLPALEGAAVPGLFTDGQAASFEGITYTLGWDEYDAYITGWDGYTYAGGGIRPASASPSEAFKGDLLTQYEYALQVKNPAYNGQAGVYPVYVDKDNYVKAAFNYQTGRLDVTAMQKGKEAYRNSFPLEQLTTLYADMKYTDSMDKGYTFQTPTRMDEIQLKRIPADRDTLFADNMFEYMTAEYYRDGTWRRLEGAVTTAPNPLYNSMRFEPVRAEALRFINREPTDQERHIYTIRVNEQLKGAYNLRTVKQKDKVLLIVDGRTVCSLPLAYPAARVGICSEGCTPSYNGILRYHLPE